MSVTATETATIRDEILGRIRELRPLFAANAARTESDHHVVEDNITRYATRRVSHHGAQALRWVRDRHPHQVEVSREVAMGCGSTAWVTALMNVSAFFLLARQRTSAGRHVGF